MVRDIFLYVVLIILFCLIFMAQLIINVYAFQSRPPASASNKPDRNEIIFV